MERNWNWNENESSLSYMCSVQCTLYNILRDLQSLGMDWSFLMYQSIYNTSLLFSCKLLLSINVMKLNISHGIIEPRLQSLVDSFINSSIGQRLLDVL